MNKTSINPIYYLVILIFLSLFSFSSHAQYYVSIMPAFYTSAGSTGDRFTCDVEFGKQWEVFSLGLDVGKINMTKQVGTDTTWYTEVRSNLNVFQTGKFTNTLTLGLGYVFNASQNMMVEATTGVEYSINKKYHYNIFFGTYYFSGRRAASNNNFFGMSLVRFFEKKG